MFEIKNNFVMKHKSILFFTIVLNSFLVNATKLTFTYVGEKPIENKIQILSYRTHDDFDVLKELRHKSNDKLTCELAFQKAQFITIQIGNDQYEMYAEPERTYEVEYEKRADKSIKMTFKLP